MLTQGRVDISDDTIYIHLAVPSIKGITFYGRPDLPRIENLLSCAKKHQEDLGRYIKALEDQINKLKEV